MEIKKYLPISAAAINGILVGANIVATRFVIDQTHPASLALMRYFIGCCCLVPPVLLTSGLKFERRDLIPIALLGMTQFGIVVTLLNYSVLYISSARAALIFATFPLLTMLIAVGLGHESATWAKSLGVVLTIVGVALALGDKVFAPAIIDKAWIGELAALGSAACGAACSVLYRPYLSKYATMSISAFAMLASVGLLAFFAGGEGFFVALPHFTPSGWGAILFVGISSGVGYYLWLWALSRTAPTNVTVFLALSPIAATILGALLLSETITLLFLVGLIFVALGLWVAHWQGKLG